MRKLTKHVYVVIDDAILSGEPIVVGTRTPVRAIVELWRQGVAPEAIPAICCICRWPRCLTP